MNEEAADWIEQVVEQSERVGVDSGQQHAWEAPIEKSWAALATNEGEVLKVPAKELQRTERTNALKAKQVLGDISEADPNSVLERGVIRYLVIVFDLSSCMDVKDYKPSRKHAALASVQNFVSTFFEQNPLSQIAILGSRDRKALMITDLGSSPDSQRNVLQNVVEDFDSASGEFSLQNSLLLAMKVLERVPDYGSREILFITGSLSSVDPSDVFDTIKSCTTLRIRCSVLSLTAEVYLFRHLTEATKGSHAVTLSEQNLDELLKIHVRAPLMDSEFLKNLKGRKWVQMGFPSLVSETFPSPCCCHSEFTYSGFLCSRCNSKHCEVPTTCRVCNLSLVSSMHLARSYLHIIPGPSFTEFDIESNEPQVCRACNRAYSTYDMLLLECNSCHSQLCFQCEKFAREQLNACPFC